MEKLEPDVRKGPGIFRWFKTPTSTIKMRFSKSTPQPASANLPVGDRSAEWLTDFETPASIKTDPILNNYLTQTMENNARSGVRRLQAEMSFIFIFPSVVRTEKTCVVF